MSFSNPLSSSIGGQSLIGSKDEELDARVDMTAMIDLVFMLNIFFLVTSLATALASGDLPFAKHVTAADTEKSIVISVVAREKKSRPQVYIGEPGIGELVPDSQLDDHVAAAVKQGLSQGKTSVIIKAERNSTAEMDRRIAAAVAAVSEDMKLFFAVMKKIDPRRMSQVRSKHYFLR